MGGLSARLLRPAWIGPLVFAALLAFAVWAVALSITVRDLRAEVETHVGWLRAVTEGETPALRSALEAMASREGAIGDQSREGLRALNDGGVDEAWTSATVRTLRGETGRLSAELGDHWSELSALVVIALFLAWMLSALYVVARRQVMQLDALRADLARRLGELADRDRELEQRLVELEDRDRVLRTVAASIVHEINNPLTYVSLNLSTVQRELRALDVPEDVTERLMRMAGRAVDGADRVAQITRDLRDLTLPDAATEGPVDLAQVLGASARLSSGRMTSAVVELEIPESLPPVEGDARRLEQVFLNLLLNAADACREKSRARIRVRAEDLGDRVAISVEDDGEGIPAAVIERVYEPFFTTKGEEGTGLGLYVSKHVVEAHGGLLSIVSEPKRGTTVRVVLPVRAPV
ncbi:MAG: HAMP domain-containing histidine kinase [Sandaracinus sp.]|nr:HAMP domain-containing histidine kinase [Sandaracinus sp.]MCB9621308.1 HAMP domain-containing histidine kinase [Sandaracinus sp.]MCB9622784.1 HAMP domain-containing histidine kinase [Sandaracinus sp.]